MIVHAVPRARGIDPERACRGIDANRDWSTLPLDGLVGSGGLGATLQLLHTKFNLREGNGDPDVVDIREWIELFARIHVPNFEHARRHFAELPSDEFAEASTASLLELDNLAAIVRDYEEE